MTDVTSAPVLCDAPSTALTANLRAALVDEQRAPAIVGGLTLLALLLRLPTIGRAYWVDEGISVGIASHRLSALPRLLRLDGSPPLFYAVLHVWLGLFGSSEVATHTLSLLISLLLVPLAWWCARTLFGPTAGLAGAALSAANPFLGWFSTETRMYPLLCGLSMLGVTLAVRASRRASVRDAAAATLTFIAVIYTHNWGLYLVVAVAGVLAGRAALQGRWQQVAAVVAASCVVLVAYLPWLPIFLQQARHTAAPWAVRPSLGDLFSDPAATLGGTLAALVAPMLAIGVGVTYHRIRVQERVDAGLAGGIGLLVLLAGWLVAQFDPSWTSRYLAVALGPLLLGLAGVLGLTRLGRRVVAATTAILVCWSVIGSLLPDRNARYAKSNVAAVAAAARGILEPGDLVVVTQTEQVAVSAHYLPSWVHFVTPTGPVTDAHVVDWQDLVARLARADVCQAIAPSLDALATGGHVLVINPLARVGASGTKWSRTVNLEVEAINRFLLDDSGLAETASVAPGIAPRPYSAVTGLIFTKTGGATSCP